MQSEAPVSGAPAPKGLKMAGIVAAIAALDVAHPARPDAIAVVTASVGVALRPADDWRDQSGIFAAADHALYEAKRSGRNRCVFEALVETEDARAA